MGGIAGYVYYTSKRLLELGYHVTVITRGSWRGVARHVVDGIEVVEAPFLKCYPLHVQVHGIFVSRLLRAMEGELDLVHFHTPLPPPAKTRLPTVTTLHTPMAVDARFVRWVDPGGLLIKLQTPVSCQVERKLLARSDLVSVVSPATARELEEYGLDADSIRVLGVGIDHHTFVPPQRRRSRRNGYILYAGRLAYQKGLLDLLECARIVCRKHPEARFVLAGDGPLRKKLQSEVDRLELVGRVQLPGHIDYWKQRRELVELYQDATVYVQPSHHEGLPASLLEAMACGRPVVATEIGGNCDAVSPGENGLLVPAHSPHTMAAAICRLLEDEPLRVELGIAARRTIEERFTWEVVTDRILKCYETVLGAL